MLTTDRWSDADFGLQAVVYLLIKSSSASRMGNAQKLASKEERDTGRSGKHFSVLIVRKRQK